MKNRWKFKNRLSFLNKYINGTNGVISLFLAILMVPFASIAGVLVNSARINSAVAIFDEALCNASNSTLGTYDKFLRERFGLLAMNQNTASGGSGYSVQQLIQDTFKEYMDKNLTVLSNTYETSTVSASGVYPLADTDVLLSQVYEAGKYTVPIKMTMDSFSVEDILNYLTKDLGFAKNIMSSISSGVSVVDKIGNCKEKFDAAIEKLKKLDEGTVKYDSAYNEFYNAVSDYNNVIDEIYQEKINIQNQINELNDEIETAKEKFDSEKENVPELSKQIEDLENEKDKNGNKVDDKELIKKIEEDNKDVLKNYLTAKKELKEKQDELREKQKNLANVESSYADKLNNKRENVREKKSNYVSKIDEYASNILDAGNAVGSAEDSIVELHSKANALVTDIAGAVYSGQKNHIDSEIKDTKAKIEDAKNSGDTVSENKYKEELEKYNGDKVNIDNDNNIVKAVGTAANTDVSTVNMFIQAKYSEEFSTSYSIFIELRNKVENGYTIYQENKKMDDTSPYYITDSNITLTCEKLKEIQNDIADEVVSSSFFSIVKTIVSFMKALKTMSTTFDPELCGNINYDYYSNTIGGLPSKKVRMDGSVYSLKSPYAESDKIQSDYFKKEISSYSNILNSTGSIGEVSLVISSLLESIEDIEECCDKDNWNWSNVWSNLGKLGKAVFNIVGTILEMIIKVTHVLDTSVYEKALLTGYIAYNIPNRTTYTKSGLLGKSYSLPSIGSSKQGYAFYGAETEYILNGHFSEIDNQRETFETMWVIRLLFNILPIISSPEITSIVNTVIAVGGVLGFIGAVAIYVLYFTVEPLVDTILMANGSDIAFIKRKPYLTPTGINNLIDDIGSMKLNYENKNKLYKKTVEFTGVQNLSENYQEPPEKSKVEGIKSNINTVNYTQMLIIIMLFSDSDKLVNRLADVIQMEASYNAATRIDSYVFDLDKSFTYLRASGSFSTNEFIKLSNSSKIYSKERIVYRGY